MRKRILIPTDFTSQAKAALMSALKMTEKLDAELFVLHSIDIHDRFVSRSSPVSTDSRESILVERAKELMEEHLASEGLDSLSPTTIVGTNSILEDVMEACEKYDIDFIVMGSSGVSGLESLFIGSNTERVV
ncbi:MAG TPA: universal stress protein, partial [Flavobacteriaceae bacterium]|nr:universal stress protein [Flavobacteriaceae bacterium]